MLKELPGFEMECRSACLLSLPQGPPGTRLGGGVLLLFHWERVWHFAGRRDRKVWVSWTKCAPALSWIQGREVEMPWNHITAIHWCVGYWMGQEYCSPFTKGFGWDSSLMYSGFNFANPIISDVLQRWNRSNWVVNQIWYLSTHFSEHQAGTFPWKQDQGSTSDMTGQRGRVSSRLCAGKSWITAPSLWAVSDNTTKTPHSPP